MSARDAFNYPEGMYLLNHSVGLPPVTTDEAWKEAFLMPWQAAREGTWPKWMPVIDAFRDEIAGLLNGLPAEVCPQLNLSSALTKILTSLTLPENRQGILYSEEDFPTIGFVLRQAERAGHTLHCLPREADCLDLQTWETALTSDIGVALITHVHSNTSRQMPVDQISALCRERGIISVVDVAQSAGVVPIDVQTWRVHFLIGSCVKWLCGGPGAGFLWVASDTIEQCEPRDVGWFSHAAPFEFDIHHFRYAEDALRFWGGTPAIQSYAVATNSLRTLSAIGSERIAQHNRALTRRLMAGLDPALIVTPTADEHRGGTVVVGDEALDTQKVDSALREAGVEYDRRAYGIRLSPHIYNDEREIDTVLACLRSAS